MSSYTVKDVIELWQDFSHNLMYNGQYVMDIPIFDSVAGTLTVKLEDKSVHEKVLSHQIQVETCDETLRKKCRARIDSGEVLVIYRRCPGMCGGKEKRFELERSKYERWRMGMTIQSLWPEMSKEDRETLISGYCNECFDRIAA